MHPSLKKLSGTAAGDANLDLANDTNWPLQVCWGQIVLTTDATVASRRIVLQAIDEAGDIALQISANVTVAASATNQRHSVMPDLPRESAFINNDILVPIPDSFMLPAGYKLRISVSDGVAGDAVAANFICRENV